MDFGPGNSVSVIGGKELIVLFQDMVSLYEIILLYINALLDLSKFNRYDDNQFS